MAEEDWGWQRGEGGWQEAVWEVQGAAGGAALEVCGHSAADSHF